METCKTCRHWMVWKDIKASSCNAPGIIRGYDSDRYDRLAPNGALVEDDEGWAIETGPDFGCVLHEPRKATDGN